MRGSSHWILAVPASSPESGMFSLPPSSSFLFSFSSFSSSSLSSFSFSVPASSPESRMFSSSSSFSFPPLHCFFPPHCPLSFRPCFLPTCPLSFPPHRHFSFSPSCPLYFPPRPAPIITCSGWSMQRIGNPMTEPQKNSSKI